MSNYQLTIGYLYGDCMNIYGDTGNIIALTQRCKWRGIDVQVKNISVGDKLKSKEIDLYFFGGGQDKAQELVAKDLQKEKGKVIKADVERGVPLLSVCGGYQLLGYYYKPNKGPTLKGVGLFPIFTVASSDRMIGNIVVRQQVTGNSKNKSNAYNLEPSALLVGFENHSGKTFLKKGAKPLGKVKKGFGNNGEDHTEGCVYKNAIGCYMHGSLLPKNPDLADWLIKKALEVKYGKKIELKSLDDSVEEKAYRAVLSKFG